MYLSRIYVFGFVFKLCCVCCGVLDGGHRRDRAGFASYQVLIDTKSKYRWQGGNTGKNEALFLKKFCVGLTFLPGEISVVSNQSKN